MHRVIGSLSVVNHFYYFLFTNLDADDFGGLYLFAGPRAILECYEGRTIEPVQIPSYVLDVAYEGFLLKPLNKILKDRNPFFPHGHSFRHSILDRIIGENDPCKLASLGLVMDAYVMISLGQHCGSPTAQLDLYNKTSKLPLQLHRSRLSSPYLTISDWDFAEGLLKLDFHMYFKGNLWTNRAEGISGCLQAVDFPTIMGEMVDNNQNSNWTKEGWACHLCLSTFFTDMLPAWWLERKKKGRSSSVITAEPNGLLLNK